MPNLARPIPQPDGFLMAEQLTQYRNMMGDNNDKKYYGYTYKYTGLYLSFSSLGVGYNNSFEYSKGSGVWGSVTVTDDTSNFTANW